MLKTSVVISTYNGERYLPELLDSIKNQSTKPDEVVICDDCSKDGTVEYIHSYIAENDLHNWTVYVNEANVGWKKNFRNAIEKSSGDLIFLCDQDDIWNKEKVSDMYRIMQNPEIECLVTNYTPFFDEGIRTEESYHVRGLSNEDGKILPIKLRPYFFSCMRPGCVFCVKRSLYEEIKDVDDVSIPHDDVFWASAIARGTLFIYQKSLIHFRRHGDNASTADAERSLGRRIEAIEELLKITNWILSTHKLYLNTNYADICKYKNFLEKRRLALKQKQLLRLIGVIISNYRCYATFRNCVADVVYLVKYKRVRIG